MNEKGRSSGSTALVMLRSDTRPVRPAHGSGAAAPRRSAHADSGMLRRPTEASSPGRISGTSLVDCWTSRLSAQSNLTLLHD